jgi:lipid-A-disaccharide synthase
MVSAGEVSGDMHAAHLVREIKKVLPDTCFLGIGGEHLSAAGVEIKIDITRRGSIGFLEALPNLLPVFFAFRKMLSLIKNTRPDLLLLVDSQGLNMPLAAAAKKLGIKTAYYISPQEWLWGTVEGEKKVARSVDLLLAIFQKEYQVYQQIYQAVGRGKERVVYHGHPLLDIVKPSRSRQAVRQNIVGMPENAVLISLCPGSRVQEIKNLLQEFLAAAQIIKKHLPAVRFVIPAASAEIAKMIERLSLSGKTISGNAPRPEIIVSNSYDLLAASDLAICASGTINMEASLLGTPNIMAYKLSWLSFLIGKYLIKIPEKIPYFSMPNILLNEKVLPELTMHHANAKEIAEESLAILKNPARQEHMKAAFARLLSLLGSPGALEKCAREIVRFLR